MKKCLVCNKRPAIKDPTYGIIPCQMCQDQQAERGLPKKQVEFTSRSIKDQRKEFKDHLIQPFRKGILSKEYVDKYGTKGIKVSDQEVKKAKNVWTDETYYT